MFVESQARRAAWLREAVTWLELANVSVLEERAELTGRGDLRGQAAIVTSRSFAAPGITAECAAPLLDVGGVLWVSQPPAPSATRWPTEGLALLGLRPREETVTSWVGFSLESPCPDRYPRRVGIPAKRPLF